MPAILNKKLKKIVLIISSFVLLFTSITAPFVPNSHAAIDQLWDHTWYAEANPFAWYQKVYDKAASPPSEIFGERYTAAQVQWITYSLWAQIWNLIPGNPELTTCLVGGNLTECGNIMDDLFKTMNPYADASTPNTASGTKAVLFAINKNPISGVNYTKNIIGKFSPVKEAQAQGFGYATAGKVAQNMWVITRNISFTFIVLAVIVMAFMIMFRVKISPQVVISVQSALPKVIATIVLITFSYAIAGFAIDLMYVVIGLVAGILTTFGLSGHTTGQLFNQLNTGSQLGAFGLMYGYWLSFLWNVLVASFVDFGSTFLVFGIIYLLVGVVAILAVIYWSIKIIFVLLKNWAMIILTIILGPLQILMGAFSAKSTFWSWLRKLISYLAVYPLIGIMFFFASFFLAQGSSGTGLSGKVATWSYGDPTHDVIPDNNWEPPFSGIAFGDNIVWITVSFIIFSQIVKVTEIIQSALAGKPFAFGVDIGPLAKGYGAYAATELHDNKVPKGIGSIPYVGKWVESKNAAAKSVIGRYVEGFTKNI